ncbi:hypothetical protein T05_11812 [Trichinella murrelli]|uniref:Uncharacterized protein n=1 Tax=Trichinella murrelli TaxID=144512 RepID=A0A0V0T2M4_9BILA|nr:hypothetical protein T05_11812 [Trichinella murrelli]
MKLVPFATRVRMDVKAFPSRPTMDYVIRKLFSRSRWHSQISFPTVLMFSLSRKCVTVKTRAAS